MTGESILSEPKRWAAEELDAVAAGEVALEWDLTDADCGCSWCCCDCCCCELARAPGDASRLFPESK